MHLSSALTRLHTAAPSEQERLGYVHTLREILQQPIIWRATARQVASGPVRAQMQALLEAGPQPIVYTGSGSSFYVGESVAPWLQQRLRRPVLAIPAGSLLTHRAAVLPPGPGLLVSIARSGDSPESAAVVEQTLAAEPGYRHLMLVCNERGRLVTQFAAEPRASVVLLDPATNDRSLVMTSSFSSLVLAGCGLAWTPDDAKAIESAAFRAERLFAAQADELAAVARRGVRKVVCLGSGSAFGIARELALKMLEMTNGAVTTFAETFLGLRHGPMSALEPDTLVVALLSPDAAVRAFERDLLLELTRKGLALPRVLVGYDVAVDVCSDDDVVVNVGADDELGLMLIGAVVGQLLAFFRCLDLGRRPDAPADGVLTRVVEAFAIHGGRA